MTLSEKSLDIARRIFQHVLSGDLGEAELERLLTLVQGASWSDEAFKVVDIAASRVAEIFHQDRMKEHAERFAAGEQLKLLSKEADGDAPPVRNFPIGPL